MVNEKSAVNDVAMSIARLHVIIIIIRKMRKKNRKTENALYTKHIKMAFFLMLTMT